MLCPLSLGSNISLCVCYFLPLWVKSKLEQRDHKVTRTCSVYAYYASQVNGDDLLLSSAPCAATVAHVKSPNGPCTQMWVFFHSVFGCLLPSNFFYAIYSKLSGNGISLHFHAEVSLILVEFFRFLCSWKIHCAEKNQKKQCNQISLKQHFKRTNDHEVSFITKTYKTYQCLDLQLATIIIFIMSVSVHYVKVQRSVFPFKSNTESLSHSSGDFFFVCIILLLNQFLENGEKRKRSYENFNSSNYKGKGKRQPSWTWR